MCLSGNSHLPPNPHTGHKPYSLSVPEASSSLLAPPHTVGSCGQVTMSYWHLVFGAQAGPKILPQFPKGLYYEYRYIPPS